jgi:HAD superfamily hydrolase (TIGR01549 family)
MSFDPANIQILSFDLDDTLWNGSQVLIKAEKAMHQWMLANTPKVFEQFSKQALHDHKLAFIKNKPQFKNKISDARTAYLSDLFSQLNYQDYEIKSKQCFDVFYHARQQVELFEGVTQALQKLKDKYRLVAITNGNADIKLTGLNEYFEFCLNAEDFTQAKPHSEIFQAALTQLQLPANQVLHIGDHPNHDMWGAYQVEMKTCWLKDGTRQWDQPFQPDLQIGHVADLLDLLTLT